MATSATRLVLPALGTSVVFVVAHLPSSPWQALLLLAGGLAYYWLCDRTGGLEASTAAHTAWNVLLLLATTSGRPGPALGPAAAVIGLAGELVLVGVLWLAATRRSAPPRAV